MNKLIQHLQEFNRKERFFLICKTLGIDNFYLSNDFCKELNNVLPNLYFPIPANSFVAMDYHLDWIYASLYLTKNNPSDKLHRLNKEFITATQEDVDLLIAFPDENNHLITHMILCECKAETGWTNKQVQSKANRFTKIFGDHAEKFSEIVIPYLVLISPVESKRLSTKNISQYLLVNNKLPWIELSIPNNLKKITRCDNTGKNSIEGEFWKVNKTH